MVKTIDDVRIITEVSEECRVELKILALRKRITLPLLVKDILEKHVSKKGLSVVDESKMRSAVGDT